VQVTAAGIATDKLAGVVSSTSHMPPASTAGLIRSPTAFHLLKRLNHAEHRAQQAEQGRDRRDCTSRRPRHWKW
jgi:hypothetical protein